VPVQTTYPGVYIEEVPSAVRTIVGVSTSVTAFLGYTRRGATNRATQVFNFGDYERAFGGLDVDSPVSYAVQQFFQNGGNEAWIVRAATGALAASVTIANNVAAGDTVLLVQAASEGLWGNGIRVTVDYDTLNPLDRFNLSVMEFRDVAGVVTPAVTEVYRNLSMDSHSQLYAVAVVNANSALIRLTRPAGVEAAVAGVRGSSTSGAIPVASMTNPLFGGRSRVRVSVDGSDPVELVLDAPAGAGAVKLTNLANDIRAKAAAAGLGLRPPAVAGAGATRTVTFESATTGEFSAVSFSNAAQNDAAGLLRLGVANGGLEASASAGLRPQESGTAGTSIGALPAAPADAKVKMIVHHGTSPDTVAVGTATNERQRVRVTGATAGSYTLSFRGVTSAAIAFNAPAADVQTALRAIPTIGGPSVNVTLGGGGIGDYIVEFVGDLAARDVPDLVPDATGLTGALADVTVTTDTPGQPEVTVWLAAGQPTTNEGIRARLEDALHQAARLSEGAANELAEARVLLVADTLVVLPGGHPDTWIEFDNFGGGDTTANRIGLRNAPANVAAYSLGVGAVVQAQAAVLAGADGTPPSLPDLIGNEVAKTGLYALADVDLFNILCTPGHTESDLLTAGMDYCERRRAFYIVDVPEAIDSLPEAQGWIKDSATPKSKNAAAYFPWIAQPDPLKNFRVRAFPPSGMLAGLYARTDGTRGVWKAPAGTDATLRGPRGVVYKLTDPENGTINPLALNAIRAMPVYGIVSWGARTLDGADQKASEWKYIPVRRLALFLEESLYRGTQWVVFEPNDEPLWAQIRLNVGAFMQNLFRQGAFQGTSPREAYLVKCDKETTTQNDINLGIVNIVVGFAPLKPAEFVILKITQLAGQVEA